MMKSTSPHDKRHTKPCRFFQKGTCPLSADRCDFSHVRIHILPVKYPSGQLKPLQQGQCEGLQLAAPEKHIEIAGMPDDATVHVVPEGESHSLEDVATLSSPQARRGSTNSPVTMIKMAHGPKLSPILSPPVSGRPPVACSAPVISEGLSRLIFRNGDSSPTSDVPSLSDGDSDPPSAPCEAPELTERWPGPASVTSPVVYCNPSPCFFSPGAPFIHPAYVPWNVFKPAPRPESRRHGMSTRKLKALKTKQCKFYKKDGRCPQGSLCTFIHDPSAVQGSQSDQEISDDSSCSPHAPSELEPKSDGERERNIYPISWRVIGGGVMMGGQREACLRYKDGVCPDGNDCLYAHPWDDDIKTPMEGTTSPTSTPRASYFPQAQMHRAADKSTMQQPASPSVPELIPDIAPIALHRRVSPSILDVRENMPPRPFSTPPRISSRAESEIMRDL